jgi:hypothetical protein
MRMGMVGNMALAQRKVLIMAEGDFGGANKALAVG